MAEDSEKPDPRTDETVRKTVQITLVVGAFATLFIVLWLASTAIIAIIAGVSCAVLFDGPHAFLARSCLAAESLGFSSSSRS
jgi:hypothetical protein